MICNLDLKYQNTDLIANCDFKSQTTNNIKEFPWLWNQIDIKMLKPHYSGMMCITRLSSKLLNAIKLYAKTYNTLFFLEALFPTIAIHFRLSYVRPKELETVTYRDIFFDDLDNIKEKDLDRIGTHVFHPLKNLNQHVELRLLVKD